LAHVVSLERCFLVIFKIYRWSYFGTDDHAKKFHENIRRYNNALAFTSVGQDAYKRLQTDNSVNDGHGPWLYKIKGELYHVTGTLPPSPGQTQMYSKLYIHDPEHCLELLHGQQE
jgi:hypothetical protein